MAKAKAVKLTKKERLPFATLLYIFLVPLFLSTILSLFDGAYSQFLLKLLSFGMLFGSIRLLNIGLQNEHRYNKAAIALAPKMKYKLYGTLALAVTLFFLTYVVDHFGIISSAFTAIIGALGCYSYYGTDPAQDKLPQKSGVNYEKLIKDLSEAEAKLQEIDKSAKKIDDLELKGAIEKALKHAHGILDTIKKDPKDIRIARKFMVVYLDGVKDVIHQYSNIDKQSLDSSFRVRLIALLNSASLRFEEELERLKSNDVFNLDVQIDALKEQLKN